MRRPLPTIQTARRRALLAGVATAGAAVAAANLPPSRDADADAVSAKRRARDEAHGYRLTDHVLRYYRTAKV